MQYSPSKLEDEYCARMLKGTFGTFLKTSDLDAARNSSFSVHWISSKHRKLWLASVN